MSTFCCLTRRTDGQEALKCLLRLGCYEVYAFWGCAWLVRPQYLYALVSNKADLDVCFQMRLNFFKWSVASGIPGTHVTSLLYRRELLN